jgi:hypothetical protein
MEMKSMKKILVALALVLFSGVAFAETYGGIPERFFSYVAQGKADDAIDFLYGTNQWVAKNSDQVINLKMEISKLSGLVGKYTFHELITEEKAGTRYAHLIYLVGYERQPIRFEIKVYKPDNQWRFQGVSFDARVTDDIEKLANQKIIK